MGFLSAPSRFLFMLTSELYFVTSPEGRTGWWQLFSWFVLPYWDQTQDFVCDWQTFCS